MPAACACTDEGTPLASSLLSWDLTELQLSPIGLKLLESKVSTTGVIMGTYVPAGKVETGSFASQAPSDAELERRARVAKEG